MERPNRDLEALVSTQKEQLLRYEKRLKDVVTAYKGLLKEKEALETSLNVVTTKDALSSGNSNDDKFDGASHNNSSSETNTNIVNSSRRSSTASISESKSDLQSQIMTLMNSLATLSAEKSRMEASFQADKKQLRLMLDQKDKRINELQSKMKENDERAKANVDEVKAKWIVERQEREKETNNQMLMIRELQKLYADERHLKENIEMQLNNFKTQFASNEAENTRIRDLQLQLKEARAQLKQLQSSHVKRAEIDETADSATILKQVRQEMQQLKEQHAVAIKNEQKRVMLAEEQSRKQAALHEDRVANLEARLAELSSTVGSYDRLRQRDQENIQSLRNKVQELERNTPDVLSTTTINREVDVKRKLLSTDMSSIVDEIIRLKKLLISENGRAANPIDLSSILAVGSDHVQCQEDFNHLQQQYEAMRLENEKLQENVQVQRSHIHTLQEKVKVLNRNIDEYEIELKQQSEKLRSAIKEERTKWKDAIAELENEYRCKISDLEQQLQNQRQRSLQLLDEKEQEIKTLQTSFDVFQNATLPVALATDRTVDTNESHAISSDAESEGPHTISNSAIAPNKIPIKSKKLSVGENCHMLYYANEIARKDIEIAGLRKSKYAAETSLRKAIQEKVSAQESLCDKIALLQEQVDRLERCKTREGANLEYLKNVVISYMVTKDVDGKRHMMNAISAVLQFTPTEIQTINAAFQKK